MRTATQAAWLQVKAPREHLKVLKALCQFVVAVLRHVAVCNGKCAFASHAAVLEHASNGAHFLFPVKWDRYYKSYLEEAAPWWRLTPRAAALRSAATRTSCPKSAALPQSAHTQVTTHSHGRALRLCHLVARKYLQSKHGSGSRRCGLFASHSCVEQMQMRCEADREWRH